MHFIPLNLCKRFSKCCIRMLLKILKHESYEESWIGYLIVALLGSNIEKNLISKNLVGTTFPLVNKVYFLFDTQEAHTF